jgi:hypothetical protein
MIFWLLRTLLNRLTGLLTNLVQSIVWFSCFFSLAYALGWVQRLMWFLLEQTATYLWNGTPVTLGSLEIDIIRGKIWATNVVIHTPKREEWKWESPLICRIGRVYVEHNWVSSILTMLFRMACGQGQKQIIEIYTLELSDIQGFIERKQHVFNFYLMDKHFLLPDPKVILEEEKEAARKIAIKAAAKLQQQHQNQKSSHCEDSKHETYSEASLDISFDQNHTEASSSINLDNPNLNSINLAEAGKDELTDGEEDALAHRQAQQLVDDIFSTVKYIGRSAKKRGSLALALAEQREQLTSKLKQLKGSKNKSEAMKEGVQVIQRVGKAVAKKTKDINNVLPKVPPRLEPQDPPVYGRVGRIIIEDARIFTRAGTTLHGSTGFNASTASTAGSTASLSTSATSHQHDDTTPVVSRSVLEKNSNAIASQGLGAKWNKPIGISEIVLRSSELCPPSSLLDDNGLPAIYQPLDKILELVWKRVLVGMAKANTSRFIQTALGEMLDLEYLNMNLAPEPAVNLGDHYSDVGTSSAGNNGAGSKAPTSYRRSTTVMSEPT